MDDDGGFANLVVQYLNISNISGWYHGHPLVSSPVKFESSVKPTVTDCRIATLAIFPFFLP